MPFIAVSNAQEPHLAGQVRILAILEPQRYARLPEIRSMSEIIPAFKKPSSWFGIFGPPGMPAEIVTRLNAEIVKALSAADVKERFAGGGVETIPSTAAELEAKVKKTADAVGPIVEQAKIKPD